MPDLSEYKVGEILSVKECGASRGKPLRSCEVNVGDATLTIVTAANVNAGLRVAVAPVGSTIVNAEGEDVIVKKMTVGGVPSEGMLCDSIMLGWKGGGAGAAAKMPDALALGEAPPDSKPRPPQATTELPQSEVQGLFEKKLTKEEKKKLAEERKAKRKAAKEAKKAEG